ncbi:MAG: hypothetical protein JXR41_06870 [Bacteroidales bacterium]|nr:hypothetical protein [Bacteroidales bacterium]MBN2762794.1 hypothetical protein [Bacteroidales bacterium]
MKKGLLAALIISVFIFSARGQKHNQVRDNSTQLKRFIELVHFNPPRFDDAFSSSLFDMFFILLDPYGFYFTSADRLRLEKYRYLLDDELSGNSWQFLDSVKVLFQARLNEMKNTIPVILGKPLDFTQHDTLKIFLFNTKRQPEKSESHQEMLYKWLKYKVIQQLTAETRDTLSGSSIPESEVRDRVLKNEIRRINRVLESAGGPGNVLAGVFFNAITACTDPHTEYMAPDIREQFISSLSSEGLSFGLTINVNDQGEIVIDHLTPGGPAWNSNELHKGDVIIRLQEAKKEAIDAGSAGLYAVLSMLESAGTVPMKITVRKPGGSMTTVTLTRARIIQDENIVKCFVFSGIKKIGYISLPGFYTEFDNENQLGCANDVAKACLKLKKENIEGLILDIRNNGGGSIKEAIDLAGIFIDFGPVALIRDKSGTIYSLKDLNRGTVYNGPLLVLVNGQSASASELFAAALQDYNRAVIAGSRTFGKATGQVILPLDTLLSSLNNQKPEKNNEDYIKITVQKIYRITGHSIQQQGVVPDILMPDFQAGHFYYESDLPYALAHDTVVKKTYFTALNEIPSSVLAGRSAERLKNNTLMLNIEHLHDIFSGYFKDGFVQIPLDPDGFLEFTVLAHQLQTASQDSVKNHDNTVTVHYTSMDANVIMMDSAQKDYHADRLKRLENNLYLQEAFFIMVDYINLITQ